MLRVFGSSCLARLPMGAMALLLVLHTQALTGSYARGGLASGSYALALALSNPILARVVDRRGQTVILRTGALLAAAAICTLALLPASAPFVLIPVFAAVAGASQPPVGACMRAIWASLLDDPGSRHAAYALESATLEVVYIFGPLAIVAGIGSWSVRGALFACAGFMLAGDLLFSFQRPSREWRPHGEVTGRLAGALAGPGVRVIMVVFLLTGLSVGAVEVGVPAIMTSIDQRDLTGVVLTFWALGSIPAGLLSGRLGAAPNPARRLTLLLAGWGVIHGCVGVARSPFSVALLLLLAGATISPTFICANGMLDTLAPPGTLTEAFTWLSTGLSSGVAIGSALAGALVDEASPTLALAVCGAGALLAAGLTTLAAGRPLAALRGVET